LGNSDKQLAGDFSMTEAARTANVPLPTEAESWRMFDRIARRYDFLNRLLSFRRDVAWRKRIARRLPAGDNLRLLDLATGTADVLLGLYADTGRISTGVGLDKSANMLEYGREKVARKDAKRLALLRGDAVLIGLREGVFDAVTMAFGIRNVPDVPAALRDIRRVLKPGGRALILEFSIPENPVLRAGYLTYFRHVLPRIGGWVSGDAAAYQYLNRTAESFPRGEAFCQLMREAGFAAVACEPLTFGVATLYWGDKEVAA
jgi:demethylmenaquinone methyltransferase/2-methoxy-6-polyprenyl-1,4-benzoquinol methylase